MIEIKETTEGDLENVRSLWADGDVMRYVGFPDGLHQSAEKMRGWWVGIILFLRPVPELTVIPSLTMENTAAKPITKLMPNTETAPPLILSCLSLQGERE